DARDPRVPGEAADNRSKLSAGRLAEVRVDHPQAAEEQAQPGNDVGKDRVQRRRLPRCPLRHAMALRGCYGLWDRVGYHRSLTSGSARRSLGLTQSCLSRRRRRPFRGAGTDRARLMTTAKGSSASASRSGVILLLVCILFYVVNNGIWLLLDRSSPSYDKAAHA